MCKCLIKLQGLTLWLILKIEKHYQNIEANSCTCKYLEIIEYELHVFQDKYLNSSSAKKYKRKENIFYKNI